MDVITYQDVGIKKCLDMPTAARDFIRTSASTYINETDRVIHGYVCLAVLSYVTICRPKVSDYCSAGFHRATKHSYLRVGGSVRNRNYKCFPGTALNTTHCPFTFCPLLYLSRPNLLSSISTVLLGPLIFCEVPSTYSNLTPLQSLSLSGMVAEPN